MKNQSRQKEREKSSNKAAQLISSLLIELQMAMNDKMESARIAIYCRELSDLTEYQIRHAFRVAMRDARYIPKIAELREWAMQGKSVIDDTRAILTRGDKPPDWDPISADEMAELKRKLAEACMWPTQDRGTAQ